MPKKKDATRADGGEDKPQRIAIVNAEKCKPKKVCITLITALTGVERAVESVRGRQFVHVNGREHTSGAPALPHPPVAPTRGFPAVASHHHCTLKVTCAGCIACRAWHHNPVLSSLHCTIACEVCECLCVETLHLLPPPGGARSWPFTRLNCLAKM